MPSSIGVTIFWLDLVEVDSGDIVKGLGGVDFSRVNDCKVVKGRGKDGSNIEMETGVNLAFSLLQVS